MNHNLSNHDLNLNTIPEQQPQPSKIGSKRITKPRGLEASGNSEDGPKRKTMEVMKCPHKNQKHYAKVRLQTNEHELYRACVIIVITSMEGTVMLLSAVI